MENDITITDDTILYEHWLYLIDQFIKQGELETEQYENYKRLINFGAY